MSVGESHTDRTGEEVDQGIKESSVKDPLTEHTGPVGWRLRVENKE